MRKLFLASFIGIILTIGVGFFFGAFGTAQQAKAQTPTAAVPGGASQTAPAPSFAPEKCKSGLGHLAVTELPSKGSFCPDFSEASVDPSDRGKYTCARTYDQWTQNKRLNFWVDDPEVTALGRGAERARQFLYWVLTRNSIDGNPYMLSIWQLSQNVAIFLILIVVIIMGVGIIIGQRNNFNLNIDVTPLIIRVAILLLFTMFSARIVLLCIQISDAMMEFFIRQLGVRELLNIYFVDNASGNVVETSERAYREFLGCSNWNIDNIEMVRTSKFLVKFTSMTYYVMGVMVILRKVVLWFLLFVAPFLSILAPFVFIRNIGWIWVGVFFQWIFYGPLMALFLGGLARIWNSPTHIPYVFDFSRVDKMSQAVYPTSINILYGGPAQVLGIWNTANYIDTFVEYLITLIMLWTVIILPWWLLRIFRDYCCDGIYAMKNIMLSMYDQMRTPPGPTPGPAPTPAPTGTTNLQMDIPKKIDVEAKVTMRNVQEIRKLNTESIVESMSMKASNITQIARMETNSVTREEVRRNISEIQNPYQAETPTERQNIMNLRDEIQTRAARGDQTAQNLASVVGRSSAQQQVSKDRLLATMPQLVPVIQTVAVKFNLPRERTQKIVSQIYNRVAYDQNLVGVIATGARVSAEKTKQVLQVVARADQLDKPSQEMITQTAKETGLQEAQVKQVMAKTAVVVQEKHEVAQQVAEQEHVEVATVQNVADAHLPAASAPELNMEAQIPASQKVSIEDYEEVKKMWEQQYESGEIPVTENITSRNEWVEGDIIRLTNILNKVMSPDKKMRSAGLDEVGYILPVFMVNNLSGEELLVYLKAKIEAAKQVKKDIAKEADIKSKIKSEEEFVDIEAPKKKEAAKTQTLQNEMDIEGEEGVKGGDGGGDEATAVAPATADAPTVADAPVVSASADAVDPAVAQADQPLTADQIPQNSPYAPDPVTAPATDSTTAQTSPQSDTQLDEIKKKLG